MSRLVPHSRPAVGRAEAEAAARVVRGGQLAQGPEVAAFEEEAARSFGLRPGAAVAVSSGTTALEFALRALGVAAGHEVLIPSFVCSALWHAVRGAGAQPVLVDCAEGGLGACLMDAARKRTRRTRAFVLVHPFGDTADARAARALGVPLVEDCAQAQGARREGQPVGREGAVSVLSFYATKLMTTGEGGMALSRDSRLVRRLRDLREYDERPARATRRNAKMTEFQAAIGRVQLRRLPSFLRSRRSLAARYDLALRGLPLSLPARTPGRAYHRYVVVLPEGSVPAAVESLAAEGILARRPVFRPLHWDAPARGRFPNAERAWRRCLSLPLYPGLDPSVPARAARALARALRSL